MPRQVEVFVAGCHLCQEIVDLVKELACPDCQVIVYDLSARCEDLTCIEKATFYGIRRVPTVVVDGRILDCCAQGGPTRETLQAAGIGQPLR